ncbi:MAG: hypothetical protein GX934_03390 [Burkholderiales bacterium]|nr:hypothetical protein [Burkholderiales bacterium]
MSTDSRSSSLPPPRFPKRGYDLLIDHDGSAFRYFVPDHGKEPGLFHELHSDEVADQFARVLLRRNLTIPVLGAAAALLILASAMGWLRLALVLIPLFALGVAWLAAYSRKAGQMRIWYNQERPVIATRFETLGRISQIMQASQKVWMVLVELPNIPGTPCSLRLADVGRVASMPPGLRVASPKGRFYLLPDGILAWSKGSRDPGPRRYGSTSCRTGSWPGGVGQFRSAPTKPGIIAPVPSRCPSSDRFRRILPSGANATST